MMIRQAFIRRMRDGRFWAVSFLALVLLVGVGLAPTAAQESAPQPATSPDAANGLAIYANRCANCHGPLGAGDGELAANLPMPPRAFTDPTFRQTAVPASFYDLIFNGNLNAGMPGFGEGVNTRDPLDDGEIWDVIASVLVLATPQEALAEGETLYAENCLACHGETGLGDGPKAADLDPLPSLADAGYWFARSGDVVLASLAPGRVEGHDYDLNDEQLTAVIDYARTFSFNAAPAPAVAASIEGASISGVVTNATNGAIVGDIEARLRAFSPAIEEMLTLTETVTVDGRFAFTLGNVPGDWVYIVNVSYEGLNFSSDVGQLSSETPDIELPVTVYDQTTDPSVIRVAQVHVVFDFLSTEILQVTELYVFENLGTAVFVGDTGDPDQGVTRVAVPANAQNLSFERAFSAMDSFIPATEVIPLTNGYADTIPLRPGRSNSSLVVNYTLPYDEGVTLSHELPYAATNVTVILPDVGVSLTNAEAWTQQNQQTMGGMFLSYAQQNLPPGSTLNLVLAGEPEVVSTAMGNSAIATTRNQSTELIIGGVGLLLVGIVAVVVVRSRMAHRDEDEEDEVVYEDEAGMTVENGRAADELIQIIAALDDAYERGELDEEAYHKEREQLKTELKAVWQ